MNFFFDANISYRISNMIAAMSEGSHEVLHIQYHPDFQHNNVFSTNGKFFGNTTKDLDWITRLGQSQRNWIVISGDINILYSAHERAALIESQLIFFACDPAWEKLGFSEQAWKMVKIWGEIVRNSGGSRGVLFRIRTARNPYLEKIKASKKNG